MWWECHASWSSGCSARAEHPHRTGVRSSPRAPQPGRRPPRAPTRRPPSGVEEVPVLWNPEGVGCDGDTVSVTAATLPSHTPTGRS
ncbi:hypothetical protein F0L17_24800 [Streptomyces sp. TRM43335]|uniref:Uncharacterized protein n=1 Tax=Streptomyces taklimakanensis TaxID=2569853 RepID=A0A6G2BK41_9ACTN|nr:hypothetical protein [Streptomyces taklimakanensis]